MVLKASLPYCNRVHSCTLQVTEGVHVALGFSLANSVMLEGPDGLVIVDVTEDDQRAMEILRHFRNISSKPIKAIVYTHYHGDHMWGVNVSVINIYIGTTYIHTMVKHLCKGELCRYSGVRTLLT